MLNSPDLTEIFKTHKSKIYHLALSIVRNEKDAEDILENTFLKVMKKINTFKGKSQLSTWIYRIGYNEALTFLRKRSRGLKLSTRLKHSNEEVSGLYINWAKLPDSRLLDTELKERIDNAIKHLPIEYRMPLALHIINELSARDTAQILKVKEPTVKTRLHRAYMAVKSQLQDYNQDIRERKRLQNNRCGIWTGFIHNYAIGSLAKDKRYAFKRHIRGCLSCNSFLNSYQQAIRITNALECRDIPIKLQQKIESFLRKNS
ncbi:MAG: sigma-70 family RNA polymerase sigma factor [Candidatus Omnitrophota bacterium]